MKQNFVAKYMRTVNKGGTHKSEKDYQRNCSKELEEGFLEYQENKQTNTKDQERNVEH